MASSSSPVAPPNSALGLRGGGIGSGASMELCYACHISPLGSRLGFFRNPKFRIPRRCLPSYSWQWAKWQERIKVSLHPGVVSQTPQRDGDSIITCRGLCKVLWSIEADIGDGYIIFLTGDPVTLGCWEPRMAILLSPCKGQANTWAVEMKVPCGIHFKYNYFIKDQNKPSIDPIWRPGPEFSLSIPSIGLENGAIVVRDSWIRNTARGLPIPSWGSWMMDKEPSVKQLKGRDQFQSLGELDTLQGLNGAPLPAKHLSIDDMPEEDKKSVGNHIRINFDPDDKILERDQPVEEPWLLRSTLLTLADVSEVDIVSDQDDEHDKEYLRKLHETEKQALEDDHKVVRFEEPVSTVILINASVCTMQRIAVLEDDKLVELLLEPVKNNVQCDSIYLGVVTKLVPHMGGAFVDIGISRPSLMDIKQNREPFIYPPFKHEVEGGLNNDSSSSWTKEYFNSHEQDGTFEDDDAADELLEGENQDDSLQIMDQDVVEREPTDEIDDPDSASMISSSDTIELDDIEIHSKVNGERSDNFEDDYTEDFLPFESGSLENSNLPLLIQQSLKDSDDTSNNRSKWAHVREGTKVIVQVVKEGLGTKGPALTAHPNLRSRFWILITRCNRVGVSKKITGAERTRLKVIAKELQPPGFGLTVRTVAAGHSLDELKKDLDGLLSTWKAIVEHAKSAALAADEGVEGAVPVMLHRAMGQTLSVVQDYFNEKVKSMVVDSPRTYHEVTSYLQEIAPDLCNRVILYEKQTPIFDEYNIEEEIDTILSKRIPLSNGGYLVIEQTEALVSIDVNGGQCVLGEGTSQEKAVLEVNLAAAKQIARELRLRDIGGIIVVDFIDMADESNRRLVYEEMKKAVERDRSTVRVSELSKLGLMEITRKRVRPSVTFMISEPCSCCHATGRVEALETSFSKIEHEICRLLAVSDEKPESENAKSWPRFVLKVDRYMCNYLTSGKKTRLAVLSSSLKVWILLKVARGFSRGSFEVKPFANGKTKDDQEVAISRLRPTAGRTYIPSTKLTLFPVKKWKSRGK